jgi:hypothetical protein
VVRHKKKNLGASRAPLLQIVGLGMAGQALTDLELMADRIADCLADRLFARLSGHD